MASAMNTVAIIQARMSSTRLPGKVLMPIHGVPLVQRVVDRVSSARMVHQVVLATTTDSSDDELAAFIRGSGGAEVFRGAHEDVLDRYYRCAVQFDAHVVVRITADDPLKDPELIDRAVSLLLENPTLHYVSNTLKPSYPEGLDIEAFQFESLREAWRVARLESEREHVTPYIWKHPERFSVRNFEYERDLSGWRWTVDKPEDVSFMNAVFLQFADKPLVAFRDVIAWLDEHPEIRAINAGTARNEGYLKSVTGEENI